MAQAWVLVQFTAMDGTTYQPREAIELPNTTDREQADFKTLLAWGVISKTPPVSDGATPPRGSWGSS